MPVHDGTQVPSRDPASSTAWGETPGAFPPAARVWLKRLAWRFTVGGSRALKRGLDIACTLFALPVAVPVLGLVGLLIKLTDGGPVLFWQKRVGLHGQLFDFPKLRSMVVDAERAKRALADQNQHGAGITFKMKNDPRITWIGRIIRKLSIDELPQLWCVLRGDMTLVGPRPPIPSEVARYTLAGRRRLEVVPGLTCLWQVQGRANIPFEGQVLLDVEYIESRSFLLDLLILARTVPAVVFGRGAY